MLNFFMAQQTLLFFGNSLCKLMNQSIAISVNLVVVPNKFGTNYDTIFSLVGSFLNGLDLAKPLLIRAVCL